MTYTDAEFNLAYKEILERVLVNKFPLIRRKKWMRGNLLFTVIFFCNPLEFTDYKFFDIRRGGSLASFPVFNCSLWNFKNFAHSLLS